MSRVRDRNAQWADLVEVQPWLCLTMLRTRNLALPASVSCRSREDVSGSKHFQRRENNSLGRSASVISNSRRIRSSASTDSSAARIGDANHLDYRYRNQAAQFPKMITDWKAYFFRRIG